MVGFEAKRSDSPLLTRKVMKEVMNKILQGADLPEIKKYLGDIIKTYRSGGYSLDEIGIPGRSWQRTDKLRDGDADFRGVPY